MKERSFKELPKRPSKRLAATWTQTAGEWLALAAAKIFAAAFGNGCATCQPTEEAVGLHTTVTPLLGKHMELLTRSSRAALGTTGRLAVRVRGMRITLARL